MVLRDFKGFSFKIVYFNEKVMKCEGVGCNDEKFILNRVRW